MLPRKTLDGFALSALRHTRRKEALPAQGKGHIVMKIYDISQELFTCAVYPGDTVPASVAVRRTARGDSYNLTDLSLCAHNGTHVDAPFHFFGDGKTVEQIPLEKTVGACFVASHTGALSAADAARILATAKAASDQAAWRRILLKGDVTVTEAAAEALAAAGIDLIGVESQSVGDENAPMAVHKILLSREVVLLEGIRLGGVPEGVYFLSAAPLKLGGADGAPCRAILVAD